MTEERPPGRKQGNSGGLSRVLVNTALAAASALFILAILEVTLRFIAVSDHNYLDDLMTMRPAPEAGALRMGDIIRLHPDDLIAYELRPRMKGTFLGKELSINSLGMRDREYTSKKPPGVFRILTLGDSHTFGWAVLEEETYPAVLEDLLLERAPGHRFEVMNLGVPGYNTVQEVQAFSRRAEELSPDMVIIHFVLNDMDLPNFLSERPDPLSLQRSYLVDFVMRRVELLKGSPLLPVGLIEVAPDKKSGRLRMPEGDIPERFQPLYGWDSMVEAFLRLGRICRDANIPYMLLLNMDDYRFRLRGRTPTVIPHHVRKLVDLCRKQGYLIADPQDRIAAYLEEQGLGTVAVWISEKDSHSNPVRNRFVAEEIFEQVARAGLIPGLDSRPDKRDKKTE